MKRLAQCLTLAAIAGLAACSGVTNGNSYLPNQNQVPLANLGKATFAVGTAKLQDGSVGLNVVSYLRTSAGSTAYLVNTPAISGPAGFVVPASTATANGGGGSGADAGTATMSATSQTASPPPAAGTTFGTAGGVFGGGIGPFNSTQSASNFYPGNANPSAGVSVTYATPFFQVSSGADSPTDPRVFLIGPPAPNIPQFTNITYPLGFAGYLPGFTAFAATPVAGAYSLNVVVAAANAAGTTVSASANLGSVTPLPAVAAPTLTQDGLGGGTVNVTVPADPRIVETLVFIHDAGTNAFYTVGPITGTGALTGALPDTLGPCSPSGPGCNAPTIKTGDKYEMTAISFDYSDFESISPVNNQQQPSVAGPGGQTDLSISPATIATY